MLQCSQIISRRASRPAKTARHLVRHGASRFALQHPYGKDAIATVENFTFILTYFTGAKYPAYSHQRSRNFNDT
jgi:hypothetical protein